MLPFSCRIRSVAGFGWFTGWPHFRKFVPISVTSLFPAQERERDGKRHMDGHQHGDRVEDDVVSVDEVNHGLFLFLVVPAGFEPAQPPSRGGVLPLHHRTVEK